MSRKKAADREDLLTHPIIFRITETVFKRLEKKLAESDCSSIGEVARQIVSDQPIKCLHVDISMNPVMEELALIRKELKAIGININQITRRFHQDGAAGGCRTGFVLKAAELYLKVDQKVDRLLVIVSKLAEQWLPK